MLQQVWNRLPLAEYLEVLTVTQLSSYKNTTSLDYHEAENYEQDAQPTQKPAGMGEFHYHRGEATSVKLIDISK